MNLIKLIAITTIVATQVMADSDIVVTVKSIYNLRIALSPNGQLDGLPNWASSGPGVLQVDQNGYGALLVTGDAGTNTVTITATSQGNQLSAKVIVIVTAPPPPATTLGVVANPTGK